MLNSAKKRFLLEDQTMYEQILDQFGQLLQQEITDFGGDFAKDEEAVWKTILSLGRAAHQRIVHRQRNGYRGSQIRCGCGGWMTWARRARGIEVVERRRLRICVGTYPLMKNRCDTMYFVLRAMR